MTSGQTQPGLLWTALDCNGPGCPWTAHGLLTELLLPIPPVFLCMPTMHTVLHLLSDDPNGKALSVLSSTLPLSMDPRATCHYTLYLTCLHIDFTMFREPRLVYLTYLPWYLGSFLTSPK